ncbi:chlorinating enzyme [Salinisphaera japonica]|uniref:Chemotaxis protein CheX n=1 Tax=Salinisphaera japonica YTM-1 TaxID=1209778 RepID=A0A423PJ40_9GAMM|nr:chlorinating enzyme [Salinisphaera japonica]ROO25610.1 chemotaxis protein CheX [Salinisphaera japonica YTM-1]
MLDQTIDSLKLTEEQLRSFWEQGYIAPVTVYTPDEMTKMWNSIRVKLLDRKHAAYALDSHGAATNIANYDRHLDVDELASHICNDVVVAKLQQILGPDVLCWRTEFFPKYPGDEGTDWHQADTFANASGKPQILWPDEDEDNFGKGTITVWTAFTRADKRNGCLQIIPSTHLKMNYDEQKEMAYRGDSVNNQEKDGVQRGFFGYDYRELQIDPEFTPDEANAVPLELEPGQCAIFWSTLMHASYPNTETDAANYRMGFAARYVPSDVKIYPDTDEVVEYGGRIPLDNYGAVVVSGESREKTNTVFTHSLTGFKFDALA